MWLDRNYRRFRSENRDFRNRMNSDIFVAWMVGWSIVFGFVMGVAITLAVQAVMSVRSRK